jgi:hypothetical protein
MPTYKLWFTTDHGAHGLDLKLVHISRESYVESPIRALQFLEGEITKRQQTAR